MASLLDYMVVVEKGKWRQRPASYPERLWLRALAPGPGFGSQLYSSHSSLWTKYLLSAPGVLTCETGIT